MKAAIAEAEGAGLQVLGVCYTQGSYDLIVISEADDEKAAAAFALATAAQGNVRSVTMQAREPNEFEEIVGMMPG